MNSSREILTLQFGNYSNYVGTHWWNIQESSFIYDPSCTESNEINHDVLFREGQNFKGDVTYTPRLLLVDLKGALKTYPQRGELYERPFINNDDEHLNKLKSSVNWDPENIEVVQGPSQPKHDFQKDLENIENISIDDKIYNFNETVDSWPDFMYSRYHPRTISLLDNIHTTNEHNPFDTFSYGNQMWKENYFDDDFTDKIRQYLEECDHLQGFQVLFDCVDGFSGLASSCLDYLNDEYNQSIFAIPIIPSKVMNFKSTEGPMSDTIRLVNIAMAYGNLTQQCSLFVPLSTMTRGWRQISEPRKFSLLDYQPDSMYQTSAILATYLDTISVRYRLKHQITANNLPGFCSDLTNYGRIMAGAGLALPFQMNPTEDLIDCLDKIDGDIFTELSPNTKIGTDRIVQTCCVRGLPLDRLKRPMKDGLKQMQMAAYRCNTISEMFQLYFQCKNYSSLANCCSVKNPVTIKIPYPSEMFNKNLTFNGFYSDFELKEKQKIISCPTLATVQNSNKLSETLEGLHRDVERIKITKIHRFKETGMEHDDFTEMLERLLELKENYEEGFNL